MSSTPTSSDGCSYPGGVSEREALPEVRPWGVDECLLALLGKRARVAAERFAEVQQVLGEHQDAVVAGAWLFDAARDAEDRDEAFVAGELAAQFLDAKQAARAKWPAVRTRALHAKI